jgi:predicted nucleotidyltransferase
MEIYAFGSIVRGEIDEFSDVDLLILKDLGEEIPKIDKECFSIYTYQRISQLWEEGNPFSWHLFLESKCLFSKNRIPFLKSLGKPKPYINLLNDLNKFHQLFLDSKFSIESNQNSVDFDLSMIFLAIRNFASCFSLGFLKIEEFSRDSTLKIGQYSIQINLKTYNRLKESRILATRGIGERITEEELKAIMIEFDKIENWFNELLKLVK